MRAWNAHYRTDVRTRFAPEPLPDFEAAIFRNKDQGHVFTLVVLRGAESASPARDLRLVGRIGPSQPERFTRTPLRSRVRPKIGRIGIARQDEPRDGTPRPPRPRKPASSRKSGHPPNPGDHGSADSWNDAQPLGVSWKCHAFASFCDVVKQAPPRTSRYIEHLQHRFRGACCASLPIVAPRFKRLGGHLSFAASGHSR